MSRRYFWIFVISLALSLSAQADETILGPTQPDSGPGGSSSVCAQVAVHQYGEGDSEYWILEPADPVPAFAPVIIFNHGWGAMSPNDYGAWIEHLVRRGNIVIYPRYQSSMRTTMNVFTPNAVAAVKSAFDELQTGQHVKSELDHVAIVGHSMGGAITPSMAAMAADQNLPIPKAICCLQPDNKVKGAEAIHMQMADLSKIAPSTLALVIVGRDDNLAGSETGKEIFAGLGQISPADKDFVTFFSDDHGTPILTANHFAPAVPRALIANAEMPNTDNSSPLRDALRERMTQKSDQRPPTALDFYGYWKLFDALTDAAFHGKNRQYALGNTPEQCYMGTWSDGTPVKPMEVTTTP